MRTRRSLVLAVLPLALTLACQGKEAAPAAAAMSASDAGQAAIADPTSIVGIAAGSKDHTTLVAALKAAGLVDALATPGPLTVFAPVNGAFDKLPAGTVETLLKPENLSQLRTVLRHHVMVSTYKPGDLTDGLKLSDARRRAHHRHPPGGRHLRRRRQSPRLRAGEQRHRLHPRRRAGAEAVAGWPAPRQPARGVCGRQPNRPNRPRIRSSGQNPVMLDWIRFTPTKAVNRNQ